MFGRLFRLLVPKINYLELRTNDKVKTRSGQTVEIIKVDETKLKPITGKIMYKDRIYVLNWYENGKFLSDDNSDYDLT